MSFHDNRDVMGEIMRFSDNQSLNLVNRDFGDVYSGVKTRTFKPERVMLTSKNVDHALAMAMQSSDPESAAVTMLTNALLYRHKIGVVSGVLNSSHPIVTPDLVQRVLDWVMQWINQTIQNRIGNMYYDKIYVHPSDLLLLYTHDILKPDTIASYFSLVVGLPRPSSIPRMRGNYGSSLGGIFTDLTHVDDFGLHSEEYGSYDTIAYRYAENLTDEGIAELREMDARVKYDLAHVVPEVLTGVPGIRYWGQPNANLNYQHMKMLTQFIIDN